MSFFAELDYRKIVRSQLKSASLTAQEASTLVGIHGSYFSRVLKGEAHFSAEQMFALGRVFQLREDEREYFLLLGELDRSGSPSHKGYVRAKIESIRAERLKLKEKLRDVEPVVS